MAPVKPHLIGALRIQCSISLPEAYRTRSQRRHGSASEDQVASVANKQIYLF